MLMMRGWIYYIFGVFHLVWFLWLYLYAYAYSIQHAYFHKYKAYPEINGS